MSVFLNSVCCSIEFGVVILTHSYSVGWSNKCTGQTTWVLTLAVQAVEKSFLGTKTQLISSGSTSWQHQNWGRHGKPSSCSPKQDYLPVCGEKKFRTFEVTDDLHLDLWWEAKLEKHFVFPTEDKAIR